jgi:hypothetical protein
MSYDPSHRKRPPRQERWPQATPAEAWPAYQEDDARQAGVRDGADDQRSYWATAAAGYRGQSGYQDASAGPAVDHGYQDAFAGPAVDHGYHGRPQPRWPDPAGYPAVTGYRSDFTGGYPALGDGFDGAPVGYGSAVTGYADARDGYGDTRDGYGEVRDAQDGYEGGWDGYREPGPSGPVLLAPDAGIYPDSWQAGRDRRWEAGRRGLIVGATTGFLAAAVTIGVSTLAAAFVGRQAAPIIVVGDAFIDRVPAAVKNVAVDHFGQHGQTMLLLGVYVAIGLLAMAAGLLARRTAALGVAALAAFSLLGAFVAITRPEGRLTDVIPSVAGGLAGLAALLWLRHASAPVAGSGPPRTARGRGRRRTR